MNNNLKQISIRSFLARSGIVPARETPTSGMYLSPLREERTPSFSVNYIKNLWYDHGIGEGGSIIDLVMRLQNCGFREAVQYMENGNYALSVSSWTPCSERTITPSTIRITRVCLLQHPALIAYLKTRGIGIGIAGEYCKEVYYSVGDKSYFALGFSNDAGGWELRNAKFKGSSTPKTVTTIDNSSDTVRVFEGFLDFLSCLSLHPNEQPISDTVVLNSAVNLRKALPFLERHRMIHTFLDNDDAGRKATAETIRLCPRCEVIDHAPSYFDHKDLNDFLQMQSDQEQNWQRPRPTLKQQLSDKLNRKIKW